MFMCISLTEKEKKKKKQKEKRRTTSQSSVIKIEGKIYTYEVEGREAENL